jgi:hypothetical protein
MKMLCVALIFASSEWVRAANKEHPALTGGSVFLAKDGSAVALDADHHPQPNTKVKGWYNFVDPSGSSCDPNELIGGHGKGDTPWLAVWIGGSTVSAKGSWKHVSVDLDLPEAPAGSKDVPWRHDMWLGPQPAPVPASILEPCQQLTPCNFCAPAAATPLTFRPACCRRYSTRSLFPLGTYWTPKAVLYNTGAFLHVVAGNKMDLNLFPGILAPAVNTSWLVAPNLEAGLGAKSKPFGSGFYAYAGETLKLDFRPTHPPHQTWRLGASVSLNLP